MDLPIIVRSRENFEFHFLTAHAPSAARTRDRDGTRGEGAPDKALLVKGAPHRRSHTASEGLHPTLFQPLGRSGRSAGGVGEETPGTIGTVSRRRLSLAGPDRRGRRSLPTRSRRSRQRPLGGRDGGMTSRLNSYCQAPYPTRQNCPHWTQEQTLGPHRPGLFCGTPSGLTR